MSEVRADKNEVFVAVTSNICVSTSGAKKRSFGVSGAVWVKRTQTKRSFDCGSGTASKRIGTDSEIALVLLIGIDLKKILFF